MARYSQSTQKGPDGKWRGTCTCGSISPPQDSEAAADRWAAAHGARHAD